MVFLCYSCGPKESDINYTVSPEEAGGKHRLRIQMTTKAEADGETTLNFPDNAWGQEELHNSIVNVQLPDEKATITMDSDSGWVIIKHRPDLEELKIEYVLEQDFEEPLVSQVDSRVIIQPDYFHVFSHCLFMMPKHIFETKEEADISIEWKDFPEDYTLQNSFGTDEYHQAITDISEDEFHSALFMGGDIRAHKVDINGNEVVFGIRDEWKVFQDSTLLEVLTKTIRVQRDFWQDHTQEYFSVSMIPTEEEQGYSYHGTGLTNSFALTASNNEHLDVNGIVYLMNHELQHNWIGHVIKNENEEEQYWFSEGFTEYYTLKNIARSNIYNLDAGYFINEFNNLMRELYTSGVKEAPNSEINYDNFWSSREYSRLPYLRGALFAFYLDLTIHKDSEGSKSLDDLMLALKEDALENDQLINHEYFLEKANQYLNKDLTDFFNTHIESGQPIDLAALYTEMGFDFEPETKVFYLGFTFSEDQRSIASVDPESEAYKAGLREGDIIAGRSIWYGSLTNTADFTIVKDGKEVPLSFLPVAIKNIPQLKDNESNKELLPF